MIYRGLNLNTGCEISWHNISLHLVEPTEVTRIMEEMRSIADLEHPNIIRWQAVWLDASGNFIILISDLMPEGSLRQYLRKIKAPREKVVKQWTSQLLQALVFLHSRHPFPLVHSFLRPDSIYVIPNTGKVVVGGLCKAIVFRNTQLHVRKYEYMAPETFTDHPGTGVDVYALGMTVLEIISQSQPYDECKSPSEIYRKTVSGHRPESVERILNEEAKDFILECIRPVEERPSATQLLQHKFLAANGNKEQGNRPVLLRNRSQEKLEVPKAPTKTRTIDVELILPDAATRRSKRIGFSYDLDNDTPDGVAMEMTEELHLSPALIPELARQIGERIRPKRKSITMYHKTTPMHPESPAKSVISISSAPKPVLKAASCETSCTNTPQRRGKSMVLDPSSPKQAQPHLKSALRFSADNDKEDVCMVQTALNQVFGPVVPTNGVFGRKTESAVKLLEEHLGMSPTGVVTEELWSEMWRRAREALHAR